MYCFRWHCDYHVNDIAGAPYKIKQKDRSADSLCTKYNESSIDSAGRGNGEHPVADLPPDLWHF